MVLGIVCLGLDEESDLNRTTLSELLQIFDKLTGAIPTSLSINDVMEISSPLDFDVVVLVDSMPSDGLWAAALAARKHLDQVGVCVVGAPLAALSAARDKAETRKLLAAAGVRIPIGGKTTARMHAHMPIVVKPQFGSASSGVQYLETGARWSIPRLGKWQSWIWEEYIDGPELTISVVRRGGQLRALQPIEIEVLDREIYDYETKVITEANRLHQPARLPATLIDEACHSAVCAGNTLGLGFVGRVDVRFRGTDPFVLDVNAEPTLHSDDFVARSLAAEGLSIQDLLSDALRDAGIIG